MNFGSRVIQFVLCAFSNEHNTIFLKILKRNLDIISISVAVATAAINPQPAQVIIEKPINESPQPNKKVILWPSNTSQRSTANVAYFVRPQPNINLIRPTLMSQQSPSLMTNVLKPVMTTGIYDHGKRTELARIPPIILPKPPVVSVAPVVSKTSSPSFIVTSTMPAKVTQTSDPNLFGTAKYPIQLVQNGNTFKTLQPLNNTQVTQIAKVLKQNRGIKHPEIVYEDKVLNRR